MLLEENVKVLVITSQNSLLEKCAMAASRKLNIPVLRIQHGIAGDIALRSEFDQIYKLVFSDFVKSEAMAVGWPKDKVKVVGAVVYDQIIDYIHKKQKKERKVLFATSPSIQSNTITEKEYFKRIKKILTELKRVENIELTIKLHPREVPTERCLHNYQTILDYLDFKNARVFAGDTLESKFYELIGWCDVFISFGSAAAVEAMIIGRPVVTIDLFGNKSLTEWIEKERISINTNYDGDVKKAVEEAFMDNNQIQRRVIPFLKRKCGIIDGKASERVVQFMEKVANV